LLNLTQKDTGDDRIAIAKIIANSPKSTSHHVAIFGDNGWNFSIAADRVFKFIDAKRNGLENEVKMLQAELTTLENAYQAVDPTNLCALAKTQEASVHTLLAKHQQLEDRYEALKIVANDAIASIGMTDDQIQGFVNLKSYSEFFEEDPSTQEHLDALMPAQACH